MPVSCEASSRPDSVVPALLHNGFQRSAESMPERPALVVAGKTYTYHELERSAASIAATIQQRQSAGSPPLTAIFGERSHVLFSGILGALFAGHGYVPLNPAFPMARTREMFRRAGCRILIADGGAVEQLPALLDDADGLLVLLPETSDAEFLGGRWPRHTFVPGPRLCAASSWQPDLGAADSIAYLLFTSGSTGVPKGVMVTHGNAVHFVCTAAERYGITADDRFSQMFDATFDLSVFDLFVAWEKGACVYCPSRATLWNPGRFIRDHALTVWFSVPSIAMMMKQLGALKPASYSSLRWSLFCGERLPVETAMAWAAAAPSSTLENLYGPTELTVACTAYRWDRERSAAEAEQGVVPIGEPLPGTRALVVDANLAEVAPGEAGELLLAGPQRTPGYWRDAQATARAHVEHPRLKESFYRTGDRVRRPLNGGPLTFLGRKDDQIKIRGHRIELGEIESTLLLIPGVESAAAIGWPLTAAGAQGIAAFVTGQNLEPEGVKHQLRARLQDVAVPQRIFVLPTIPLNANGKVDRHALSSMLDR
jgi:amino acid adenylation domain-containing protein